MSRTTASALCLLLYLGASETQAEEVTLRQPDGSKVRVETVPGRQGEIFEDADSYTIVRVHRVFEYASQGEDGSLVPSGVRVGTVDPRQSALPRHLTPAIDFLRSRRALAPGSMPPPNPEPIQVQLSDGKTAQLKMKGSGAYHWYEDDYGYAVTERPEHFDYALRGPNGSLVPSGIRAGSMSPEEAGIRPGLRPK
jgi:hypothetical protein